MKIHCIAAGALQCNCYLIENGGQAVLIDCGGNGEEVLSVCKRLELPVAAVLLTHGHVDHIEGIDAVVSAFACPVYLHKADGAFLENPAYNLSARVCLRALTVQTKPILFDDDAKITVAGLSFEVIHTPGHTPGSVCFACGDVLFTGDTLFQASVGNEFPPFGDFELEIESIRKRLFTLEEDRICYPGHGAATSLFYEKKNNPYCRY